MSWGGCGKLVSGIKDTLKEQMCTVTSCCIESNEQDSQTE